METYTGTVTRAFYDTGKVSYSDIAIEGKKIPLVCFTLKMDKETLEHLKSIKANNIITFIGYEEVNSKTNQQQLILESLSKIGDISYKSPWEKENPYAINKDTDFIIGGLTGVKYGSAEEKNFLMRVAGRDYKVLIWRKENNMPESTIGTIELMHKTKEEYEQFYTDQVYFWSKNPVAIKCPMDF